ncbi:MAG: sigma-54-dependent Fis family transcriptional regulator [bacterium]|nr:sigma-54-dependent Fis family transcriptional regulator [bacterium]
MIKILLVEDQEYLRDVLIELLQQQQYHVDSAADLKTAAMMLEREYFDVIILDLKLPDGNSITLLEKYQDRLDSRTIIITANATVPSVVAAIKKGAANYLEKPIDKDLLIAQVEGIVRNNSRLNCHQNLLNEVVSNFSFNDIVYESKAMEAVVARAKILATTNNTILIDGETGCGKEVIAHSIRNGSPRKKNIFLPVNCASIPEQLFESELFGFEKGAFTGAESGYCGKFVLAEKGTLFLDEIGELPLHIQAKLLRVLDDRKIFPLKGQKSINTDVRLITATNRKLKQEVTLKQFRSDLYYRLMEASITIPPLRERAEDILPLIRHFINVYNHIFQKNVTRLSPGVEKHFLTYPWEGNVRELKNTIKSIIPFINNNRIDQEDLAYSLVDIAENNDNGVKMNLTMDKVEKDHIYKVLKLTNFNVLRSAELLGMHRSKLYRRMKEYGLDMLNEDN